MNLEKHAEFMTDNMPCIFVTTGKMAMSKNLFLLVPVNFGHAGLMFDGFTIEAAYNRNNADSGWTYWSNKQYTLYSNRYDVRHSSVKLHPSNDEYKVAIAHDEYKVALTHALERKHLSAAKIFLSLLLKSPDWWTCRISASKQLVHLGKKNAARKLLSDGEPFEISEQLSKHRAGILKNTRTDQILDGDDPYMSIALLLYKENKYDDAVWLLMQAEFATTKITDGYGSYSLIASYILDKTGYYYDAISIWNSILVHNEKEIQMRKISQKYAEKMDSDFENSEEYYEKKIEHSFEKMRRKELIQFPPRKYPQLKKIAENNQIDYDTYHEFEAYCPNFTHSSPESSESPESPESPESSLHQEYYNFMRFMDTECIRNMKLCVHAASISLTTSGTHEINYKTLVESLLQARMQGRCKRKTELCEHSNNDDFMIYCSTMCVKGYRYGIWTYLWNRINTYVGEKQEGDIQDREQIRRGIFAINSKESIQLFAYNNIQEILPKDLKLDKHYRMLREQVVVDTTLRHMKDIQAVGEFNEDKYYILCARPFHQQESDTIKYKLKEYFQHRHRIKTSFVNVRGTSCPPVELGMTLVDAGWKKKDVLVSFTSSSFYPLPLPDLGGFSYDDESDIGAFFAQQTLP